MQECSESISVFNLLLMMSTSTSKEKKTPSKTQNMLNEITQLSLTVLLALSFYNPVMNPAASGDTVTFFQCMTEKQNFDIF